MPTDQEHRLFERMSGGSGNEKLDTHIALHLQRIVDVPERDITSFVRTRDRNSMQQLKAVLKDMPRGRDMSLGSTRAATRDATAVEAQKRLKEMSCPNISHYGKSYGEKNGQFGIRTTNHAFDGMVRKSFQPHLDYWWSQADENQVRVLADTCRALRVFTSTKGPPTTYKDLFPRYSDVDIKPPLPCDNATNISTVPLGMIYDDTADQKASRAKRDKLHDDTLLKAMRHQAEVRNGAYGQWKTPICGPYSAPANASNALACVQEGKSDANTWKSELKSAFVTDVHSRKQRMRYAVKLAPKGDEKWKGCAATPRKRTIPYDALKGRAFSSPTLEMNL